MLNIQRLDYILKELRDKKTVYVADLAERYYVSPSTIRRDLASLEREGIVRRIYGGAVLIERDTSEIPYLIRQKTTGERYAVCASGGASAGRYDDLSRSYQHSGQYGKISGVQKKSKDFDDELAGSS